MDFNPDDKAPTPVALGAGWHTMRIVEAEEKVSSKGNPMLVIELQHPEQPDGIRIRDYLVATQAALWKVEQVCAAAGNARAYYSGRVTEADLRGRLVRVELAEETVDGYDRPLLKAREYDTEAVPDQGAAPAPAAKHAHPDTPPADGIPF